MMAMNFLAHLNIDRGEVYFMGTLEKVLIGIVFAYAIINFVYPLPMYIGIAIIAGVVIIEIAKYFLVVKPERNRKNQAKLDADRKRSN